MDLINCLETLQVMQLFFFFNGKKVILSLAGWIYTIECIAGCSTFPQCSPDLPACMNIL